MNRILRPTLLWAAAVTLGVLGTALVFVGVTAGGLVLPGVMLIDAALLLAAVAGGVELAVRGARASAVKEEAHAR